MQTGDNMNIEQLSEESCGCDGTEAPMPGMGIDAQAIQPRPHVPYPGQPIPTYLHPQQAPPVYGAPYPVVPPAGYMANPYPYMGQGLPPAAPPGGQVPQYAPPTGVFPEGSAHTADEECSCGSSHITAEPGVYQSPHPGEPVNPKHELLRYGQLIDIVNGIAGGNPDMDKIMGVVEEYDGQFWKGILMGAAAALIVTNDTVKETILGAFGSAMGIFQKDQPAEAPSEETSKSE